MPSSSPRRLIGLAAIVVALIVGHYLGALSPLERLIVIAARPINQVALRFPLSSPTPDQLSRDQAALQDQIGRLSVENAQLRASLDAATDGQSQLEFLATRHLAGVTVRVLTRSSNPTSQIIVLDHGADAGITVGSPVVIHDGVLIGLITEVAANSSRVLLTTDNRSSIAGVMADNAAAQGVITGARGLSLKMDLIPQNVELKEGELVVTSGIDPHVVPGLLLGQVERFEKQQGAVLQSASLTPLYAVQRIDAVTVLTSTVQ